MSISRCSCIVSFIAMTVLGLVVLSSALRGEEAGAASSLQTASTFEGTVWVDARPAPATAAVVVTVGATSCATATVTFTSGGREVFYSVEVPSEADLPGCGTEGAEVTFTIDGEPAKPTGVWKAGQTQKLDIWSGEDFAAFSGKLLLDGQPLPTTSDSALLEAFIGATRCGSHTASLVQHPLPEPVEQPAYHNLIVLPETLRAGCGKPGDTITFTVDGVPAAEAARKSVV